MVNNITLTPQEHEDLKDTVKFRTKTSLYLKQLVEDFREHCESSQPFRDDVKVLKTHRNIQWWFIGGISLSIILAAIYIIKVNMAGVG